MSAAFDLFHGTSRYSWENAANGLFFVTNDIEEAKKYAYEMAAFDEENGLKPKPVVVYVSFDLINGLEMVEDNPANLPDVQTWEDSLARHGSFAVVELPAEIKAKLKVVDANKAN